MRRFRFAKAPAAAPVINRETGTITGASAIQAVEALGHDLLVDQVMLTQVATLGNAAGKVKSRFTHPGLCSDGMGKMLGHLTNWRVEGDKTVGDLQLIEAAANAPGMGDLRGYVLDLAEQAPQDFGLSIVFSGTPVWKLPDGSEIKVNDQSLRRAGPMGDYFARPDKATTDKPFARAEQLFAADVVDEPAANRDGLFSAAFSGTTSAHAEQLFGWLDEALGFHRIPLSSVRDAIDRYAAARAIPLTATPAQEVPMSLSATLKRLAAAAPTSAFAHIIVERFGQPEAEIVEAVYNAALAARDEQITALNAKLAQLESAGTAAAAKQAEQLAAVEKARDALAAQVASFKGFSGELRKTQDPGADPASGPTNAPTAIKEAWDAKPALREFFHDDFDTFKTAAEFDGLAGALKNAGIQA